MDRADSRKYHFIYKTTCLITGRWYIGMHSTNNLDDGYLGSGKRIWYSIKKYGEENHVREILEFFSDRKSLAAREKEIVNEEMLKEERCMNLIEGGGGFDHHSSVRGGLTLVGQKAATEKMKHLLKTDEIFRKNFGKKIKASNDKRLANGEKFFPNSTGFTGHTHTKEHRLKLSEVNKIKQAGEKNSQFGTCWINNGEVAKKIKKEQLDEMLSLGWKKGRKIIHLIEVDS